jgi:hypothetical protein
MKPSIVVATWGIGPSYRTCVKDYVNSMIAKNTLYDLHIVIMTDLIEFFDDMCKIPEVKCIFNVHDAVQKFGSGWTGEYIPHNTFDPAYREEVKQNMLLYNHGFSYNMRRFLLPVLADIGYTKFFIADPDHELILDEHLISSIDTPINTVMGICHEVIKIDTSVPHPHPFIYSNAFGMNSLHVMTDMRLALHLMYVKLNETRFAEDIYKGVDITEGPLRYFNFESVASTVKYFKYWDTFVELVYTTPGLQLLINQIGELRTDFIPVSAATIANRMKTLEFPRNRYISMVYKQYKIFGDTI